MRRRDPAQSGCAAFQTILTNFHVARKGVNYVKNLLQDDGAMPSTGRILAGIVSVSGRGSIRGKPGDVLR
jgi:hypothetical protein